jgi:hypothetical protein
MLTTPVSHPDVKNSHLSTWPAEGQICLLPTHSSLYTWHFIMFSVITNIYNKKTKRSTLMDLFTATEKLKKFFWQLEMFDVCTKGDTAHIDMIFKFLPHTCQQGCIDILHCCNDPCLCLYHAWMVLSVGGSFAYFAWNARCTVTTDLLVWYSNTQNNSPPRSGHFLTTYTRIA